VERDSLTKGGSKIQAIRALTRKKGTKKVTFRRSHFQNGRRKGGQDLPHSGANPLLHKFASHIRQVVRLVHVPLSHRPTHVESASTFWPVGLLTVVLLFHGSIQMSTFAQGEEVMTNETVIRMVKAGLSPNIIIAKIKTSKTRFDTSDAALIKLAEAKVPNEVIAAMMEAQPPADNRDASKTQPPLPNQSGLPVLYIAEETSSGIQGTTDVVLEAIKTFREKVPGIRITRDRNQAEYTVLITRRERWNPLVRDTKIAIVNRKDEVIFSRSARSVGGAIDAVIRFFRGQEQ
jgi:hypothetical protein